MSSDLRERYLGLHRALYALRDRRGFAETRERIEQLEAEIDLVGAQLRVPLVIPEPVQHDYTQDELRDFADIRAREDEYQRQAQREEYPWPTQ